MRKLILLCALVVPLVVWAEEVKLRKEVVCNDADLIYAAIDKAGEQPIWIGELDKTSIIVTVNIETQDWTVIQTNGKLACVIDIGKKFKFRLPEPVDIESGPMAEK